MYEQGTSHAEVAHRLGTSRQAPTAGTASGDTTAASKAGELRDDSLKDMAGLWHLPGNPSGNPVDVTAPVGM